MPYATHACDKPRSLHAHEKSLPYMLVSGCVAEMPSATNAGDKPHGMHAGGMSQL